jgi:pyrimidine operon attenuation protein/uracil phosphoribosyltransferase
MLILGAEEIRRSVLRLAVQVSEQNKGVDNLVILGIRTRGVILARRIQREIERLEGVKVPLGILDIALYRDDLLEGCDAVFRGSEVDFSLDGKNVAVCDDVLYTGRTARAALSAISSLGRAKTVKLYTLIDRGHRELPFRADGTGKNVPTSKAEKIVVRFRETDGEDSVYLLKKDEKI